MLISLGTLARLMSRCAAAMYKQPHKSLAHAWDAASGIRRDLLRYADHQREALRFSMVGPPNEGESGVCQTIISTRKGCLA